MRVLADIRQQPLTGYRALVASLIGAASMAVAAQLRFHIPGTCVPFTMQPFVVVMCGMLLGSRVAALSMVEYLAAGLAGAPVFAGFAFGPAALVGVTGGYLIGFIPAAFVIGKTLETLRSRDFGVCVAAGVAGVVIIYTFGVAWLAAIGRLNSLTAWAIGAVPFVGMDIAKVAAAAAIASGRRR